MRGRGRDGASTVGLGRARGGAPILFALSLLSGTPAAADELWGYLEWGAVSSRSDQQTEPIGTSTDSDSLVQRYSLNFDKSFYPALKMRLGGVFEAIGVTNNTQNFGTETDATSLKPIFDVTLRTKLYLAQFIYTHNKERQSSNLAQSTTQIRNTYRAIFGYFPERLPSVRFQFLRADTFDGDREVIDVQEDRFQLIAQFKTLDALTLYYRGETADIRDGIDDSATRTTLQSGRIQYFNGWWNRRLSVNTDYRITQQATEGLDQGSIVFSGLSALDDTPDEGPLDPNPALVDGNLSASAGINLGLPPTGGNDDLRNMGLEFAAEDPVNRLLVWVDRELPVGIAESFIWTVYTSADNEDWTQWQIIPNAPFDPLLHQWELNFPNTNARFIKAVTAPLSPTVPFASEYTEIFVTELQGVLTGLPSQGDSTRRSTVEVFNFDTRVRILNNPGLYYELTYVYKDSNATTYTLRNGLSLNHRISPVYSVVARISHENGEERSGSRNVLQYSASLAATAIPTLRHSLVFSGRREDLSGFERDLNSVFLLNTLQFYPGIDMNLALGKLVEVEDTGQTDTIQINFTTTIVPHPKMRLNLTYDDRSNEFLQSDGIRLERINRGGELSVAYNPLRTLYLFGSYRAEKRTGLDARSINNYSLSWTPFPEGTLELGVRYNETLITDNDRKERSIVPRIRWNFSPRSYIQAAYQSLSSDSTLRTTNDNIFSARLRLGF